MGKAMRYLAGVWMAMVLLLGGCATLGEGDTGPRLAVQYAALKYIGEDQGKAQRIHDTAGAVLPGLTGSVTLAMLEVQLRERIDWQRLDMADRLLLDTLITELAADLHTRMGDGVLDPEQLTRVEHVVAWVQQAARMAGAR
jgi:hypothetical protein